MKCAGGCRRSAPPFMHRSANRPIQIRLKPEEATRATNGNLPLSEPQSEIPASRSARTPATDGPSENGNNTARMCFQASLVPVTYILVSAAKTAKNAILDPDRSTLATHGDNVQNVDIDEISPSAESSVTKKGPNSLVNASREREQAQAAAAKKPMKRLGTGHPKSASQTAARPAGSRIQDCGSQTSIAVGSRANAPLLIAEPISTSLSAFAEAATEREDGQDEGVTKPQVAASSRRRTRASVPQGPIIEVDLSAPISTRTRQHKSCGPENLPKTVSTPATEAAAQLVNTHSSMPQDAAPDQEEGRKGRDSTGQEVSAPSKRQQRTTGDTLTGPSQHGKGDVRTAQTTNATAGMTDEEGLSGRKRGSGTGGTAEADTTIAPMLEKRQPKAVGSPRLVEADEPEKYFAREEDVPAPATMEVKSQTASNARGHAQPAPKEDVDVHLPEASQTLPTPQAAKKSTRVCK